jgi:fumarate reductase subunit D
MVAFALAIWVRLQYIGILGAGDYIAWAMENYFGAITPQYLSLARGLLDTGTYASIAYPPGYPALIALAQAFGIVDLQQLRAAQVVLDSTGVFSFFLLLRASHVIRSVSLLGATLYAAYPLFAAGSTFLLAESLSPVLMLWSLTALVYVVRSTRRVAWIATGAGIGVTGMIRPDLILFIGIAIIWGWLMGNKVGRIWAVTALVIGFSLPVGAWGIHNRVQHGVWLFTTTGGGAGLWEGLGAIPNEYGYVLSDEYAMKMLAEKGLAWHSIEADRWLKQDYLRAWRDHPEHVVRVISSRWDNILRTSEFFSPNGFAILQRSLDIYGVWISLFALIMLRRNPAALLTISAPILYALFSIGLVHWEARYVRYVHIGYLCSVLILFSRCVSLPSVQGRLALIRHAGPLALAALIGLLLPPASRALYEQRVNTELASRLPDQSARGELIQGPDFKSLDWSPVGAARVALSDENLSIETTPARFEYQAMAKLATNNVRAALFKFSVEIGQGGAAFGVLDQRSRWLSLQSFKGVGRHEGLISTPISPNDEVTLILSNNNEYGVSRFKLVDLQIQFSAPRSASPPTEPYGGSRD